MNRVFGPGERWSDNAVESPKHELLPRAITPSDVDQRSAIGRGGDNVIAHGAGLAIERSRQREAHHLGRCARGRAPLRRREYSDSDRDRAEREHHGIAKAGGPR